MEEIKNFFTGLKEGFESFASIIVSIVNYVLLSLLYSFGIGPVSIIAKVRKKHFIELGKEKRDSYWVQRKEEKQNLEDHYKMY